MERLTLAGILLGLACFAASAYAGPPGPPRVHAAGAWPSAEQITAYGTAICGVMVTAANTAFYIWHKLRGPGAPRKPRRRKPRPETPDHAKPT